MALRTRVSMSAIGSLVTFPVPPFCCRYQLAFTTPGTSPFSASCRKHKRQIPYLRRNALGRPQRQQRLRWRHLNFGFFRSFAILAVVAIKFSFLLLLRPERHTHLLEQRHPFGVSPCSGGNRYVHPLGLIHFRIIDFGEN